MYADDTTLFLIGTNVDEVVDGLNRALSDIYTWSRNNKLTIHSGKSEAMIISHRSFCGPLKPIKLGDKILNFVSEARCLGVTIDSKLSWNSHIEITCKSFGKKINQLKRLKYLPKNTLETIYFTSIVPSVTYCNLVWGTCLPSLMNELEHLHARAAKIIHRLPCSLSDQDALLATGWEPLDNLYKKKLLTLMYKVHHNLALDRITSLFSPNINPKHSLRNKSTYVIPRFNLEIGRTALRYRGPLAWNSLPATLKQAPSVNNFKCKLKQSKYGTMLDSLSFLKEACLISHKSSDFKYY